jgi:hypothetical protein
MLDGDSYRKILPAVKRVVNGFTTVSYTLYHSLYYHRVFTTLAWVVMSA